ncbi:LacI family DNA-binding transcriptional regulator [Geofilum sp. OHC36d9]|uniref:LacI family DNA-binding transcriptional regulator n=1 Tax=Geofilum sp. OHC36d9 TaxID=3458413 RepID=UPI004033BEF3
MKSSHITIKDIAKILGISASTVSRALKDHPDISEETRNLVKVFAEKVNYRPNALALSLRKQKTNTLGLIIPEIVHHFFSSVISGMEDVAYGEGYHVMICQSNENYLREVTNIQALMDLRVDGLLVSMSKTTKDFTHFRNVIDDGTPIVFFDRICDQIESDRVIFDDFEGARIATTHLIDTGAKNILHLSASRHLLIGKNRYLGYCQALRNNNIEVNEDLVLKCDTREEVYSMRQHILALAPHIDGLFAVNDSTAIAAMQILQENGFKVPEQISVVGFGDGPNATITTPTLTTVEQKGYEMGREAVRLLIQRLENPNALINYQTKIITPTLQKRNSTK